jgi:hypothetical protein
MIVELFFSLPYPFLALFYNLFSFSTALKCACIILFECFMTCISVIKVRIRHLGSFHQIISPIFHFKIEILKGKRRCNNNVILVAPGVIIVSYAPTSQGCVGECPRSFSKRQHHL